MPALLIRYAPHMTAGFLFLALLFGAYRHGVTTTETAWQARHNAELAKANQATADAQAQAREAERRGVEAVAIIEGQLHDQQQQAQADRDRLLADIDSGAVRVRDRFTCPAAGGMPGAATSAGQRDAGKVGGLRREDVRFLVRLANEADAVTRQLQACQQILQAERMSPPAAAGDAP